MTQSGYNLHDLVREAQTRWLKPAEVLFILQNQTEDQLTHEPAQKPASGSLFLFNKRVLRFFRKDGHSWRKKKDGRTVGEAHERLKVGNVEALNCYYALGEENPLFQRRSYWMLDPTYEHIVLVHYREIGEGRHSSGSTSLSPESPSTLSQSPSSYTAQYPGSLTVISELHEPYLSPGSIEVSSDAVVKTNWMDHLGMTERKREVVGSSELEVTQALRRRLEMQLSLTDDAVEEIGPFCNENENPNDSEAIINDEWRSTASLDELDSLMWRRHSGFQKPDEQNLYEPEPKSRREEDLERLKLKLKLQLQVMSSREVDLKRLKLRLQVLRHSYPTIVISGHGTTGGTALEGGVLSMGELVRLDEMGEVVTQGQRLSSEDEESLNNEVTQSLFYKELEDKILLEELKESPLNPRELEEFNCDPIEVPPTFSPHFSIIHVLDLSYSQIRYLPQSISRLTALQKVFLRSCELLIELPPEIGELTTLQVLDLEGTELLRLPKEIAQLVNLTCLKVSFYGYASQIVIPRRVLSNLSSLIQLIIDVTPFEEWWDVEVEAIVDDLFSLKELKTLQLYLPTAEPLEKLKLIFRCLAKFRFTVGSHEEHFITRLPQDVEVEFNNREKGLKYLNANCIPNGVTEVLKHANAFFLQRHWTTKSLSEFGHKNMTEVKFCLVMECNELRTIIDTEQFDEGIVFGSLERLIVRYMKNMESIWKGPIGIGSLSNLKSLALHTCPNLTTLFTVDMLINLTNLEELVVEDCPKIDSLMSLKSSDSKKGLFLRSLKKISLLELPELVSISGGLRIAPNLERMVIFYCPKLERLSTMEVSSPILKVIKGEKHWWDALKWYESDLSTEDEDYLAGLFVPLRVEGDLMTQITKD